MGKYNYMNLNQKMIRIRKKVPKLIRKRYSEDVTYDFVKLDDIYECLTPALNKYGVDFDILSERPTQMDEQGNSVFLKEMGTLWRYEADLELCWTNADRPGDKVRSFLHVIGTIIPVVSFPIQTRNLLLNSKNRTVFSRQIFSKLMHVL